jgi:hypothetical protein
LPVGSQSFDHSSIASSSSPSPLAAPLPFVRVDSIAITTRLGILLVGGTDKCRGTGANHNLDVNIERRIDIYSAKTHSWSVSPVCLPPQIGHNCPLNGGRSIGATLVGHRVFLVAAFCKMCPRNYSACWSIDAEAIFAAPPPENHGATIISVGAATAGHDPSWTRHPDVIGEIHKCTIACV